MTLVKFRMQVPTAKIDRSTTMEQGGLRRFRDTVSKVRKGRVVEVKRRFVEDYDALRDHGEHVVKRTPTRLHRRRVVIALDEKGKKTVRDPDREADIPLPAALTRHEPLTDRYDLVLPTERVAVGARWTVGPKRFARLFAKGFHNPRGSARCRLESVSLERLDKQTPPERYAKIRVSFRVEGPVDAKQEAARRSLRLKGLIRVSLKRRQIVTVTLTGTTRLVQVETEQGHTRTLTGEGSAKIQRRAWFPRRPKRDKRDKTPPKRKQG